MNPWNIFLEMLPPDSGFSALPPFDKENDVVLFFKYYDPKQKRIHYCGHHYLPIASKPTDLIPILNKRAGELCHHKIPLTSYIPITSTFGKRLINTFFFYYNKMNVLFLSLLILSILTHTKKNGFKVLFYIYIYIYLLKRQKK